MQEILSRIEPTIDEWLILLPVFIVCFVIVGFCLSLLKASLDSFFKKHAGQHSKSNSK